MEIFLDKIQIDFLERMNCSLSFKGRKVLHEIEDGLYGKILVTKSQWLMLFTSLPFLFFKDETSKDLLKKLWFDKCDKCKITTNKISVPTGCLCPEIFVIGIAPSFASIKDETIYRIMSSSITGGYIRKALYDLDMIDKVWYTNIIKCAMNHNRKPNNKEIKNCSFWLEEELRILKPKKIICLGNFAYEQFTKNFVSYPVYKVYHPSYFARKGFGYEKYYDHVKEVLDK